VTDKDVKTIIMRRHGLSGEDADKVIDLVATETLERWLASQPLPPSPVERSHVMQTVEGVGDDTVVRTWVSVESMAYELAPKVTALVCGALSRAFQEDLSR
jgi:hypothetical protein